MGRLAGSVVVTKTVEMMVTTMGSPPGVEVGSTDDMDDMEDGSTGGMEVGKVVEDGSIEGSTAVGVPGLPLERVTLGSSN